MTASKRAHGRGLAVSWHTQFQKVSLSSHALRIHVGVVESFGVSGRDLQEG